MAKLFAGGGFLTPGYFKRLYEMEENAEVRAMFEGWVRRFAD